MKLLIRLPLTKLYKASNTYTNGTVGGYKLVFKFRPNPGEIIPIILDIGLERNTLPVISLIINIFTLRGGKEKHSL